MFTWATANGIESILVHSETIETIEIFSVLRDEFFFGWLLISHYNIISSDYKQIWFMFVRWLIKEYIKEQRWITNVLFLQFKSKHFTHRFHYWNIHLYASLLPASILISIIVRYAYTNINDREAKRCKLIGSKKWRL